MCSENETVVQIKCLPIRSWTQKSNTEVDAGGEEGWSAVRAAVCVPASCYSHIRSLDVKPYLCYFAPNNHAPLRFRDGIWVMSTERRSIVLPFICAEELLLSVFRWDRNIPSEADTLWDLQSGSQQRSSPLCQHLCPLPRTSFIFNGLIAPVISLNPT